MFLNTAKKKNFVVVAVIGFNIMKHNLTILFWTLLLIANIGTIFGETNIFVIFLVLSIAILIYRDFLK